MNAEQMWSQYGIEGYHEAWAFEQAPDELAALVISGIKTATCSPMYYYDVLKERMPQVGDHSIILDSKNEAVCIIKTTALRICPFDQVDERQAYKEGEGDRSLAYWRQVHEDYLRQVFKGRDVCFDGDTLLLCEEFEVVWPKQQKP